MIYNDLKEEILQRSNNGLDFYKYIIGDNLKRVNETRFKNVKNPFYNDKNAGLSIYLNEKGIWSHYDYGNTEFRGDVFHFCAFNYKLDVKKDFRILLDKMIYDLNNNTIVLKSESHIVNKSASNNKAEVVGVELFEAPFSKDSINFWLNYGVTIETLKINKVIQITGYCMSSN